MSRTGTAPHPAEASRRKPLVRLVAHGVVAGLGLAVGALAGWVTALWLGLIDFPC
jgi:hypothetical protein